MKISYQYTFSQFSDNFIAQYYSGGIRVFTRLFMGPTLFIFGILMIGRTRQMLPGLGKNFFWAGGSLLVLSGFFYFLRPALQLLIVRLRKDQLFGENGQKVELTLNTKTDSILIHDSEGESELALEEILYIQHRNDSSWIITNQDQTIPIPRNNLTFGDHDEFISAIENILDINEQKH